MEDIKKILIDKAISPHKKVDAFCKVCWTIENSVQEELFELLTKSFSELSYEDKVLIIPKLNKESFCYNPFVFLAYDLLMSLPKWKYSEIELGVIWWSHDDRYTVITKEEYEWRKAHNLKCSVVGGIYERPSQINDFLCFEKSVHMTMLTNSNFVFLE